MLSSISVNPKSQKGTILITVMLLFAVGVYMATEITYRQKIDIQRTFSVINQAQSYNFLLGAEEIAKYALRKDLKDDKKKNRTRDHQEEDWGSKMAQPLEGGIIEGQITDLQGKFNLNWLIQEDASNATKVKAAFVSLLAQLKIPEEIPAQVVADQLVDLLDEDSTPTSIDGKEESEYMLEEPPRRAGNRILVDVSELMLLPSLTQDDVEKLAPYVTVLPTGTSLNVNTALTEVLQSFECVDPAGVSSGMPDKGYTDIQDVAGMFSQDKECKDAEKDFPVGRDVASEFYELSAKAVIEGKTVKVRSILYRSNQQDSNIEIKVIYRKQVDPYSNV